MESISGQVGGDQLPDREEIVAFLSEAMEGACGFAGWLDKDLSLPTVDPPVAPGSLDLFFRLADSALRENGNVYMDFGVMRDNGAWDSLAWGYLQVT